jgi:type IV pilus assembly protein PilB
MTFLLKLVQQGHLKEQDVQGILDASEKEEKSIETLLKERGITDDLILEAKSQQSGAPIRVIGDTKIPYEVLKFIPEESSSYYKIIPLAFVNGILEVGMVDPENIEARDALQFISSRLKVPFKVFLISQKDFDTGFASYRGLTGEVTEALSQFEGVNPEKKEEEIKIISGGEEGEAKVNAGGAEQITDDAPVAKIVSVMLRHAVEGNASDIHIEHLGEKVRVRFRVDGELFTSIFLPKEVHNAVVSRIKILSNLKLDEKRKPQDGRFTAHIEGRKVDFRVSTFPTHYGEKVVMRILDSQKGIRSLEELGMSTKNLGLIKKALDAPYGMILITGPTGSGKSTTLYSMVNALDRETQNIVSLENPIEYNIPGLNQSQVRPEIGYTFATGLRSVLRQDPDVIMVGEIRDKETAELAIQAALTGHLVLATLHTNSAVGAIPRLVDMGIDPYLIAPTLILSVAQRLVRMLCDDSKDPVPVSESWNEMIKKQFSDLPEEYRTQLKLGETIYRPKPSQTCPEGVRGRAAVLEILEVDKDIERVILKNPVEPEIWKVARSKGMLSMREDAILKALDGTIPFDEINSV